MSFDEVDIAFDGFFILSKVLSAKTILEHQELFSEHEINVSKDILTTNIGIY